MKIIIIGGGIGGLATYLSLEKHLSDISPLPTLKIYESHPDPTSTTATIGGGLGLAPNGMRAISHISRAVVDHIDGEGFHGPKVTLRNAQGRLLGRFVMARRERVGFDQLFLARAEVHRAFVGRVPEGVVEWGKKVVSVKEEGEGGKVKVVFEDGSVEEADMVIGADGVRSVVREAVLGDGYEAEYQRLTGVGGFLPMSSLSPSVRESLKTDPVTMTFGPEGFFGYGPCTKTSLDASNSSTNSDSFMWWSTYEANPAPPRDTPLTDIHAQLSKRHGFWTLPYDSATSRVYSSIIDLACGLSGDESTVMDARTAADKNVLILPRYITPRLPRWCTPSGNIILIGDAAHAMPPDTGQGVSCAVEDGLAIGMLLKHYLGLGLGMGDAMKSVKEGMRR